MDYIQFLGSVVVGSGTLASILGVFFAIYAKQNGRITRDFITSQGEGMRDFIAEQGKETKELISKFAQQNREAEERVARIIAEMKKDTQELLIATLSKFDEKAERRHIELKEAVVTH